MGRKKWITIGVLAAVLSAGAVSGCLATGDGGIQAIEQMSDSDYAKWRLYVTLGVKIGANRLLGEGMVSVDELELIASTLEALRDQSFMQGGQSFILPALREAGLTNDEITLVMLILEQELLEHGALSWIDSDTGLIALSPRTKEVLTDVVVALRSAAVITPAEGKQAMKMNADFSQSK